MACSRRAATAAAVEEWLVVVGEVVAPPDELGPEQAAAKIPTATSPVTALARAARVVQRCVGLERPLALANRESLGARVERARQTIPMAAS